MRELRKIENYIKELLETTECVVIPSFGGFVSEEREAQINTKTHVFSPPYKDILFNDGLTRDDGVLLHYLSLQENISYSQAKESLNLQVDAWKTKLVKGEQLVLNDIGTLELNRAGNFEFEPDRNTNYAASSFGLQEFISPNIRQLSGQKVIAKSFKESSKSIVFAASFLFFILLFSTWFMFQWNAVNDQYSQQSSILPKPIDLSVQKEKVELTPKLEEKTVEVTKPQLVEEKKEDKNTISSKEIIPSPVAKHFIVAGAFRDGKNARKYIQKLKRRGFDAGEAGLNPNGLVIVYYAAFMDAKEAVKTLKQIKHSTNSSAWLYSKK